jgi:hypothetical protein
MMDGSRRRRTFRLEWYRDSGDIPKDRSDLVKSSADELDLDSCCFDLGGVAGLTAFEFERGRRAGAMLMCGFIHS